MRTRSHLETADLSSAFLHQLKETTNGFAFVGLVCVFRHKTHPGGCGHPARNGRTYALTAEPATLAEVNIAIPRQSWSFHHNISDIIVPNSQRTRHLAPTFRISVCLKTRLLMGDLYTIPKSPTYLMLHNSRVHEFWPFRYRQWFVTPTFLLLTAPVDRPLSCVPAQPSFLKMHEKKPRPH